MNGPIASAVVLPEQDEESPPQSAPSPTSLKRRQSSTHEQDVAKRLRIDGDGLHPDRRSSITNETTSAAPVPKGRERGRERRLFGAALGALSQNSASAAQRRRSEIEKRQQAQRKQEDDVSEQRKLERLARRKAQRWKEHEQFEKISMRIRHDSRLAHAHFLRTTAEPRLFYKPWETTQDEDDLICDQIAEVRKIIRQEVQAEQLGPKNGERERSASREGRADPNADAARSGKTHDAVTPPERTKSNSGPADASGISTNIREQNGDHAEGFAQKAVSEQDAVEDVPPNDTTNYDGAADDGSKEVMSENGEEVVEAAEDTVIY